MTHTKLPPKKCASEYEKSKPSEAFPFFNIFTHILKHIIRMTPFSELLHMHLTINPKISILIYLVRVHSVFVMKGNSIILGMVVVGSTKTDIDCFRFISQKFCSKPMFAALWSLYFSLYQVGQTFLWFQW